MTRNFSLDPTARGLETTGQDTCNLSPAEFFGKNYQKLKRYCQHRWGSHGEDVAHEAMQIALEKKYAYMTFSLFALVAKGVARDMGVYEQNVSLDELVENGHDFAAEPEQTLDERIEMLRQDPRFKEAIEKILDGINITAAVANYSQFIRQARQAVKQPSLFSGGAR
jgi:hypothetical protein